MAFRADHSSSVIIPPTFNISQRYFEPRCPHTVTVFGILHRPRYVSPVREPAFAGSAGLPGNVCNDMLAFLKLSQEEPMRSAILAFICIGDVSGDLPRPDNGGHARPRRRAAPRETTPGRSPSTGMPSPPAGKAPRLEENRLGREGAPSFRRGPARPSRRPLPWIPTTRRRATTWPA